MTGSMTAIAATATIASRTAALRGSAHAIALRADALVTGSQRRASALAIARKLTHHLANPPGETEVTTKGGFGEDQ